MIIAATSACTALGDSPHVEAAIRAGLNRFRDDALLQCRPHDPEWEEWEPARTARVAALDPLLGGSARLLALAATAGRDLAARAQIRRSDLPRAALLVGTTTVDAVAASWQLPGLATQVAGRLGLQGLAATETLCAGRTALFAVLERAQALVAGGTADTVLALIADSLLVEDRFSALDEARRVRSTRSPGGMLPGEAAIGLVLRAGGSGIRCGKVGRGREPQPLGGPQASSGTGLQHALAAAVQQPSVWALPDLTSEEYRTREWGVALTRQRLDVRSTLHTCAHLGDCGAANAAVAAMTAAAGLTRQWGAGPALVTAGDDDGGRAAVLLEKGDA